MTVSLVEPGKAIHPRSFDSKIIFFLGLLLAASGLVSPPIALVGGIAFGFTVEHPLRRESSSMAKLLLQVSVIALGFGMNLHQVLHAGRSGFLYTAISITAAMTLGRRYCPIVCEAPTASLPAVPPVVAITASRASAEIVARRSAHGSSASPAGVSLTRPPARSNKATLNSDSSALIC